MATQVLSSDRVCRNKNRKHIYNAPDPKQDAALWSGRAFHCVLQLAANWQRRVMEVVESFSCRLLLLAKDRPEMDSSEWRTIAAEIAATETCIGCCIIHFPTAPPCSIKVDVLETGVVPIFPSSDEKFGMTIELDPKRRQHYMSSFRLVLSSR